MKESNNSTPQKFLNNLKVLDESKYQIIYSLREILFQFFPDMKEKVMYGGIIFTREEDFCGLFAYTNHVSLEISYGVKLKDPDKLLEGKGKFRRHIKIRNQEDVEAKRVEFFVNQLREMAG